MGTHDQVIIKCGKDYHSTAFGGQCPDNNTGQNLYDTEDNLFSISPTQMITPRRSPTTRAAGS